MKNALRSIAATAVLLAGASFAHAENPMVGGAGNVR